MKVQYFGFSSNQGITFDHYDNETSNNLQEHKMWSQQLKDMAAPRTINGERARNCLNSKIVAQILKMMHEQGMSQNTNLFLQPSEASLECITL